MSRVTARRGSAAVQLPLFPASPQMVHVGHLDRQLGLVCVMCRAHLETVALYGCCDTCPGLRVPVPPWMGLGAEQEPVTLVPERAA